MRRITSALFLDFDNIFSSLLEVDRDAAMAVVDDPALLINGLRSLDDSAGLTRDVIVRRAYLNPTGTVRDPALAVGSRRLPLSAYRSRLVRGGFEVIDCPPLTKHNKTAADIRLVIDVLDAMAGPVRYDEVIVASRDADFTPLLIKLRALDRRTMIISSGDLAPAYRAAADRLVDQGQLIDLLRDPLTQEREGEERAAIALVGLLSTSGGPVTLSATGIALRQAVGTDVVDETKWFGRKTLTRFVQELTPQLQVDATRVWDPTRHTAPVPAAS